MKPKTETHKVVKFMVYDRRARKGSSAYSPKSHSAPHFVGHYVEGMKEWANERMGQSLLLQQEGGWDIRG